MLFCFALAKSQLVNKMARNDFKNLKRIFIATNMGFPSGFPRVKKMHFFSVFCFGIQYIFKYDPNNFESITTTGIISLDCFALCIFSFSVINNSC